MSDERSTRRFRPSSWFRSTPRAWTPAIEQELAVIVDRRESDLALLSLADRRDVAASTT